MSSEFDWNNKIWIIQLDKIHVIMLVVNLKNVLQVLAKWRKIRALGKNAIGTGKRIFFSTVTVVSVMRLV